MNNDEELNRLRQQRQEKYRELKQDPPENYGEKYDISHKAADIRNNFESLAGTETALAGRLMAVRVHGKATFADIQDVSGKIQLYFQYDKLGEEDYEAFQDLDIGDIVGLRGEVFKTNRGEVSINVSSYQLLTKALRPLPEKFHGLKDKDLRYRQRYVDLIVNSEVQDTFKTRSKIIRYFRRVLEEKGFLEVETPMMHPVPGGATARPFITHHNTLDLDLYLRIAPELYLKRLIVGGLEKVFELNRCFRNEGMSYKHNPEFTMMELYQAHTDYEDMMDLTEEIISGAAREVLGSEVIEYEGEEIDLSPPWNRITMKEAVKKYTGFDYQDYSSDSAARKAARDKGLEIDDDATRGQVLNEFFEQRVEDNLIDPTFVLDYPLEVSPLAQKKEDDPGFTYRFEGFIYTREIANAFTELNDPEEQRERFEKQVEDQDDEDQKVDEDFIRALEYGMPPTGGLGIGIDRLIMLLTDSSSIRDVILFPTMRPEGSSE